MILAGAYNLGFFIELAEYFIFLIFRIVVNVYKRETVKTIPPGFKFKSGYPRHHYLVTNWFTCNKLRVLCLTKPGA
nr:MAG TPA: hypothetical protein [Bacteriophage sp.]